MIMDLCKLKINLIWNSPYSPKQSPIEELFGYIKKKLENKLVKNSEELMN